MIKKYWQFLMEKKERTGSYEYGCVLLELELPQWDEIIKNIDINDLYQPNDGRHGLETDPHISLKYGLEANVSASRVKEILEKYPLTEPIQLQKIDIFQQPEFDVVKLTVSLTPEIVKINHELSQLPNQDQFPNYNPHITIAYVLPGTGKKYIQEIEMEAYPEQIIYSKPNHDKFYFPIKN